MDILKVKSLPSSTVRDSNPPNLQRKARKEDRIDLIEGKWKCIDVVLGSNNSHSYWINIVLQNTEDSLKVIDIDRRRIIDDYGFNGGYDREWVIQTEYNDKWNEIFVQFEAEEKKQKEQQLERAKRDAAFKRQFEQEEAKRKQALTAKYGAAMAGKIIAGKFEIGMSKAICAEISGYASIIEQTATTETWKVNNWAGASYLYFVGDNLVRIVNQ